ncbi:HEAT repeat domain-containing protein [Glaciecola sp. MH2013]|uniref:HEAT repeat domain-containing protein n=1 Tax=Glaciecola sp. MH2013 TaxID=2785524 RepID=UPI0018A00864|nr:HEAT repeat domain-containing protein [Glaciecola sp. MH2013]MBF7073108.1 HEAT repeat domain-containing protein [Glaciecola sp. MH2013]
MVKQKNKNSRVRNTKVKWNRRLSVGFLSIAVFSNIAIATECKSANECIALIPEVEGKAWGPGKVDYAVRDKLKSFGRDALLQLAKLTGEDDPNRRAVADSLIAKIRDLNEDDFVIIHKVIQNNIELDGDGGWSYGALGYVGGDKAGKYLVSELKRVQSASNQIGTAFSRLGVEGIPYLIEGLRCFESCGEKDFWGFNEVFRNYQKRTKVTDDVSARRLFQVASNEKVDLKARTTAMSVIGYITENPQIAKKIYQYADENNEFSASVLISLQNMKSPLGAGLLVKRLSREKDEYSTFNSNLMVFRDLSEMGQAANSVGGDVMAYLNSESWEDRIHSAVTLGYIGYNQAVPELLKLVSNEVDWQQAYAAIKALHLLAENSTVPHIEKVANTHWYKPLREYAQKVVASIKANKDHKSKYHPNNFAFDFLDYQQLREENHTCDKTDYAMVSETVEAKQYGGREKKLESFQYKNPMCSSDEYGDYYKDYCTSPKSFVIPSLAVKFGEKWLTGDNRGEWGGELIVFEDGKATKTLLNENIEDVYVIDEYAYVITGLAHLSSNNGLIYRLELTDTGYYIEPFYRLPGAPRTSWKISNDSVLINTVSGAVIFNPDIGLSMASCK